MTWVSEDKEYFDFLQDNGVPRKKVVLKQLKADLTGFSSLMLVIPSLTFMLFYSSGDSLFWLGLAMLAAYLMLFFNEIRTTRYAKTKVIRIAGEFKYHPLTKKWYVCKGKLEGREVNITFANFYFPFLENKENVKGMILYTPKAQYSILIGVESKDD